MRATKSVSQFTSISTPIRLSCTYDSMRPCEAARSARFSALAMPALRSASIALFRSPPVSASAFLHSIIPAPVISRSCFTWSAVIVMSLPCSLERPPAA